MGGGKGCVIQVLAEIQRTSTTEAATLIAIMPMNDCGGGGKK